MCYSREYLGGGSRWAKQASEKNGARKSEPARKNFEFRPCEVTSLNCQGINYLTNQQAKQNLKSQCHPKCFACRGTFFMYEKYAIFLIVAKSDLYLLLSLPLAILKHKCEFWLNMSVSPYRFRCIFPNSEVFSRWRGRSLNWMPRRVQESWGEGRIFRDLPKLYGWRSPCISSGGKEKHLRVSAMVLILCLPK